MDWPQGEDLDGDGLPDRARVEIRGQVEYIDVEKTLVSWAKSVAMEAFKKTHEMEELNKKVDDKQVVKEKDEYRLAKEEVEQKLVKEEVEQKLKKEEVEDKLKEEDEIKNVKKEEAIKKASQQLINSQATVEAFAAASNTDKAWMVTFLVLLSVVTIAETIYLVIKKNCSYPQ